MVNYDPGVIKTFAKLLYERANTVIAVNTVIGVIVGAAAGKFAFGNGGMAVLAFIAGAIGYLIGSQKAFLLKLQAQTALCQVQIEQNTRGASALPDAAQLSTTAGHKPTPQVVSPPAAPAGPMGTCPNCTVKLPLAAEECPKCKASFGPGSAWKVKPV